MIELELDGKKIQTNSGLSILEVALKEGKYIPHFCYHKKLSIAANCRMCLVEVEKSAKPLPACATPVTDGMKIHTCSKLAIEAQKGVMEFLLINHPLDCPVCDQGGECQLQDIAVGYGGSSSRFTEEKRVVSNKDLGPLISTEMTRCIHCSRCVRFTDEIAGYQELGMGYRNNHVEVMPFIGKTVDSELSGNIIDLCPVGALNSKPFRNSARNWELSRRKSISPFDGLGSNLIAQVDKYHKVVRVLPFDNDELNECWISDRDRFSYEGLYHKERITKPMIKQNNEWIEAEWDVAIAYVAKSLHGIKEDHGADHIGVIASPMSTLEELYLLQKLMRSFGVYNLDHRLTQNDFSLDGKNSGAMYLGGSIEDVLSSKSVLIIGSMLREEDPIFAAKIRKAVKNNLQLNVINIYQEELLCTSHNQITVEPREFAHILGELVKLTGGSSVVELSDIVDEEISEHSHKILASIKDGAYILLGEIAKMQNNYSQLVILSQELASNIKGKFGILSNTANEVGARLVEFTPHKFHSNPHEIGMNIQQMLNKPRKAYFIMNTEVEYDCYNSKQTLSALNHADTVMVLSPYINENMKLYADVILPITPFAETSGSFINTSGVLQKFNAATRPYGGSKPIWKVLRIIANVLGVEDFQYDTIDEVRCEIDKKYNISDRLNNNIDKLHFKFHKDASDHLVRFGAQSMYGRNSITRRAESLQLTKQATLPVLMISKTLADKLEINGLHQIQVVQSAHTRNFNVVIDDKLAPKAVRLMVHDDTLGFGGRFDDIQIQK